MALNAKKYAGKLYLLATPIGNLKDITLRALDTLNDVDVIACEDTRHTLQLLTHFDIKKPLVSYHEHNRFDKAKELIPELLSGKNIALVTDAGTPIISDPGDVLVKEAIENDIDVVAIPGACACISALIVSGLDASAFTFIGFLPDSKKEKIVRLESIKEKIETTIIYSSKSQIKKDLDAMREVLGDDKKITISREMTKVHEEVIRGTIKDVIEKVKDEDLLGEFVICIDGRDIKDIENEEKEKWKDMSIREHVDYYIDKGYDEKESMKLVAKDRNIDKSEVYKDIKVKEKNDG
ncbi:MAG: 16S rRNA (cytidine(1402)-2'-O)-methyltransferase [Lachnospiraceae bacterium]|nr:16S rRNA (cytidine(1402)-2'-O)-methyltransferase [Lachnospiraceae bacterium]